MNKIFLVEKSTESQRLFSKRFGQYFENENLVLSDFEVLFLLKEEKIVVKEKKGNELDFNKLIKKLRIDYKTFLVFYDLRKKGYGVYSGLKFGTDFRVYEKGIKPGEDHSKWLIKIISKKEIKNEDLFSNLRVSHSTRKELVYAFIDKDNDISYVSFGRKKF